VDAGFSLANKRGAFARRSCSDKPRARSRVVGSDAWRSRSNAITLSPAPAAATATDDDPGVDVHIWGPASSMLRLEARLSRYLSPPLFPVHLRDLPKVVCHEVPRPPFEIGPFRIQASLVCHPGPTVGYRLEAGGRSIVYLPDHEPALALPNGRWPAPDWISGYDLAFKADFVDSRRTVHGRGICKLRWMGAQHLPARFRICGPGSAKRIVPFNHDRSHDDDMLDRLLEESIRRFKSSCSAAAGREGAVFSI
jgi:hypothetical protein